MNLWFNYPFLKLLRYFRDVRHTWGPRGIVLRVGPVALCLVWQGKRVVSDDE